MMVSFLFTSYRSNMKNQKNVTVKIFVFFLVLFFCILAKVASCSFLNDNILENVKQSCVGQRIGKNSGTSPISLQKNAELDFFAESDYLSAAILADPAHPIKSAVCNYTPRISSDSSYDGGAGRLAELLLDKDPETQERPVYWWGITSILRPLLCIMTYDQIMTLTQIIAFLLWIGATITIYQLGGRFPAISFAISGVLVNNFIAFMGLDTVMPFIIAYSHIILASRMKKDSVRMNSIMVNGMLTVYFDWMSTPIISFAYPVMVMLIQSNKSNNKKILDNIIFLIRSSINWIVGYAGMNIAKWAIASIVLQKNVFMDGIVHAAGDISKSMVENLPDNLFSYLYETFVKSFMMINIVDYISGRRIRVLLCLIAIIIVVTIIKYRERCSQSIALLLCSFASFAWLIVFHGHMWVHPQLTYRIYSVFLWGIMLYFYYLPRQCGIFTKRFCKAD